VLPHAIAYNAAAVPDAIGRVARALGVKQAAPGLFDMAKAAGAPTALRDIGMPENGLDRAADLAVADPYWNPRPIDRASIRALLDDSWHGRRPQSYRREFKTMRDFNENTATAAVIERMSNAKDARFKEIMTAMVTHLHAAIREVEPTLDE